MRGFACRMQVRAAAPTAARIGAGEAPLIAWTPPICSERLRPFLTDHPRIVTTMVMPAVPVEGVNAVWIRRVGSPYRVPVSLLLLTLFGTGPLVGRALNRMVEPAR